MIDRMPSVQAHGDIELIHGSVDPRDDSARRTPA
jgi:hypothetical protein